MQEFKTWVSDAREIFPLSLLPPDPPFFFGTLLANTQKCPLRLSSTIHVRLIHVSFTWQVKIRCSATNSNIDTWLLTTWNLWGMTRCVSTWRTTRGITGIPEVSRWKIAFQSFLLSSPSLSRSDWISDRSWALWFSFDRQFSIFSLSLFSIHCKVQRGITKGCSRRWRINWILASVEIFLRVVVARVRL